MLQNGRSERYIYRPSFRAPLNECPPKVGYIPEKKAALWSEFDLLC